VHVTHPNAGPVTARVETIAVDGDLVTFCWTYEFVSPVGPDSHEQIYSARRS